MESQFTEQAATCHPVCGPAISTAQTRWQDGHLLCFFVGRYVGHAPSQVGSHVSLSLPYLAHYSPPHQQMDSGFIHFIHL